MAGRKTIVWFASSIGSVNRRLALVTGGIAVALAALWRAIRRRPPGWTDPGTSVDPRADALRARLEESRVVVDDREEFQAAETPVDAAETVPDPDERRREIHAEGRSAVDRMREARED
jgi:hypothetical protein